MHRRARHLNPASAGATLALDSRFITGLSDGDPVSTWTDRSASANNATGSGTARPTFETNEQGGQPALRFDGVNDAMECGSSVFTGTQSRFIVVVYKTNSTGTFNDAIAGQSQPPPNSGASAAGSWFVVQARTRGVTGDPYIAGYSADTQNFRSTPDNLWKIGTGDWDGTTLRTRKNAFTIDAVNRSLNTSNCPFRIGWDRDAATLEYLDGFIGSISSGNINAGLSLLRRLEHAAAFAFKIPCS